jgi:hypothetical protein
MLSGIFLCWQRLFAIMWLYYWLCNDWIFLINDLRKNQKEKNNLSC